MKSMAWRPWYREVGDQILHATWAAVSVVMLANPVGWTIAGMVSLAALVGREIKQYPPNPARPYDIHLDIGGYLTGAGIAALVILL